MSALMGNYIALAATTYYSYAVEAKKQSLTTIPKGDGGNGNWWGDRVTGRSWRSLADTQTWSPVCSLYCIKSGWRSYSWWLLDETELHVFSEAPWEKIDKALNFCRCPLKDNAGDNPVCSLLCPNSRIQTLSLFEDYYQLRPAVIWTQKDSDLDFNPSWEQETVLWENPTPVTHFWDFAFKLKPCCPSTPQSVHLILFTEDKSATGHRQGWSLERPLRGLLGPWEGLWVSWAVDLLSCEENAARRWFSLGPGRV